LSTSFEYGCLIYVTENAVRFSCLSQDTEQELLWQFLVETNYAFTNFKGQSGMPEIKIYFLMLTFQKPTVLKTM
jgi:hypothetical protein